MYVVRIKRGKRGSRPLVRKFAEGEVIQVALLSRAEQKGSALADIDGQVNG